VTPSGANLVGADDDLPLAGRQRGGAITGVAPVSLRGELKLIRTRSADLLAVRADQPRSMM
jgi:hypothetical protein